MPAYHDAEYQIRRYLHQANVSGASSASMAKFLMFGAARLNAAHLLVTTAGTNTDAGVDIYVGTASVGQVVYGTETAGSVVHSSVLNATVPNNGVVELKGKATSATAVVSVCLEYELTPNAQES